MDYNKQRLISSLPSELVLISNKYTHTQYVIRELHSISNNIRIT